MVASFLCSDIGCEVGHDHSLMLTHAYARLFSGIAGSGCRSGRG